MERACRGPGIRDRGEPLSPPYGAVSRRHYARCRFRPTAAGRRERAPRRVGQSQRFATRAREGAVPRCRAVSRGAVRVISSRWRLRRRSVLGSRPALVLVLSTAAGCTETRESAAAQLSQPGPSATVSDSRRSAITRAVERVAPAVVTVQTEAVERVQADPLFEWMYGRQ